MTSSICEPRATVTSPWPIVLTLYLWTISSSQWRCQPGRFSMVAHRHDRRGIYRCVLLRFRGRIEIDHSYGLRWSGLCCHSRHSTRGVGRCGRTRPRSSSSFPYGYANSIQYIVIIFMNIFNSTRCCKNSKCIIYPSGPYYWHALTLIPAWISNRMPSKVRGEITYPFLNVSGCTFEVKEWINNFIPHFILDVIAYPCWD